MALKKYHHDIDVLGNLSVSEQMAAQSFSVGGTNLTKTLLDNLYSHRSNTGLDEHTQYLTAARGGAIFQPIGDYAGSSHNHAGVYEPVFSKNTGFNKNFGSTVGTVAEGNHVHNYDNYGTWIWQAKNSAGTSLGSNTITSGATATIKAGTGITLEFSGGEATIINSLPNVVQTTISGNAGSATKLATARTINGVLFDGTANISIAADTPVVSFLDLEDKPNTYAPTLGTTSTTAYRGDYGNIAYNHSQAAHAPSDANNYVHPTGAGNNHIPSGGASGQFLKWSSSGVAVWAADNNTTYTLASLGYTGATNANYITDNTQIGNGRGYITSYTDTNTWRPLGTTSATACAGDDGRLSDARPASDVYSWAKASTKPTYTYSEVGAQVAGSYMTTSHPANNITSTHLYMSNGDGFVWNDTSNVMYVRKDSSDYVLLDSGNYNSYAPTKTGGGASGTWEISIEGGASSSVTNFVNEYNSTTTMRVLGSHNGINSNGNVYSTSGITMRMDINTIYATTFSGNATSSSWATSSGNADTVAGLAVNGTTNNAVNKIVRTDGNGYANFGWINTISGTATGTMTRVYTSQDGYLRYLSPASFISSLGLVTTGDSRLSDSRPASDVYSWAKASSKPSYTYSEVGAAASSHSHSYIPLSGGTITGDIIVGTSDRDNGMFGTYDSTKTQHIWSMGTSYKNSSTGTNFGNLYGLAYKHTNNTTGGSMAGGHQMVWAQNGTGTCAMGTGLWTSGLVYASGGNSGNWNAAYSHAISAHAPSNANYITDNSQIANGRGYITSSGTAAACSGNAATATWADKVDVNASDTGANEYKIVWSSGDTVYSTSGITINRDAKRITATTFAGSLSGNASSATYATSAGSAPASDVYSWAKASSKPSYSASEVGLGNVSNTAQVTTTYNSSLNSDSRNSAGVTRLYRKDSNSNYSVQTYWTGSYWHLDGYSGDSYHAGVQVAYADNAGRSNTCLLADGSQSVIIQYNNNSNSTYQVLWGSGNNPYGTSGVYINPYYNVIYAGDHAFSSDARLKENVVNLTGVEMAMALRPITHTWIDKKSPYGPYAGFIAQEVQKVLPSLVSADSETGMLSVSYAKVSVINTAAIQAHQKDIVEIKRSHKEEVRKLWGIIHTMQKEISTLKTNR